METACPVQELTTDFDRVFYISQKALEVGIRQDKLLDDVITCVSKTKKGFKLRIDFKPWNKPQYLSIATEYTYNDLFGYPTDQSFFDHAQAHAEHLIQLALADAIAVTGGWRY